MDKKTIEIYNTNVINRSSSVDPVVIYELLPIASQTSLKKNQNVHASNINTRYIVIDDCQILKPYDITLGQKLEPTLPLYNDTSLKLLDVDVNNNTNNVIAGKSSHASVVDFNSFVCSPHANFFNPNDTASLEPLVNYSEKDNAIVMLGENGNVMSCLASERHFACFNNVLIFLGFTLPLSHYDVNDKIFSTGKQQLNLFYLDDSTSGSFFDWSLDLLLENTTSLETTTVERQLFLKMTVLNNNGTTTSDDVVYSLKQIIPDNLPYYNIVIRIEKQWTPFVCVYLNEKLISEMNFKNTSKEFGFGGQLIINNNIKTPSVVSQSSPSVPLSTWLLKYFKVYSLSNLDVWRSFSKNLIFLNYSQQPTQQQDTMVCCNLLDGTPLLLNATKLLNFYLLNSQKKPSCVYSPNTFLNLNLVDDFYSLNFVVDFQIFGGVGMVGGQEMEILKIFNVYVFIVCSDAGDQQLFIKNNQNESKKLKLEKYSVQLNMVLNIKHLEENPSDNSHCAQITIAETLTTGEQYKHKSCFLNNLVLEHEPETLSQTMATIRFGNPNTANQPQMKLINFFVAI